MNVLYNDLWNILTFWNNGKVYFKVDSAVLQCLSSRFAITMYSSPNEQHLGSSFPNGPSEPQLSSQQSHFSNEPDFRCGTNRLVWVYPKGPKPVSA